MVKRSIAAAVGVVVLLTGPVDGHPTEPAQVRQAVARSLPFLAEEGTDWIAERKCASCHHTSFLVWSHQLAARAGFEVDAKRLKTWTDWALQKQLSEHDEGGLVGERNVEGLSQFLLGADPRAGREQQETLARFAEVIVSTQQADGGWQPGGQLPTQKRPKKETAEVSTMWALLALGEDSRRAEARKKARASIEGSSLSARSTEWYALRLLVLQRAGTQGEIESGQQALLARQNQDGGWSWRQGDPSDALATGQALWALAGAGVGHRNPAVRRAWRFLVESQDREGAWAVKSTKASKQDEELFTSVYWGTAWAVIGLLETLPTEDR